MILISVVWWCLLMSDVDICFSEVYGGFEKGVYNTQRSAVFDFGYVRVFFTLFHNICYSMVLDIQLVTDCGLFI